MRYETIKSVLLIFLVITSGVLTWNLWIFQPTYEFNDEKHVHEVSISDPKDIEDVIRPVKLLFHLDTEHYGIVDEQKVDDTLLKLSNWTFYDIGRETEYSQEQIRALAQNGKTLELLFPGLVPFDLYKGILRFETEELPVGEFDRIIIQFEHSAQGDGTAYFVSAKEGKVYESHVNHEYIQQLFDQLKDQRDNFDAYEPYELPDGRVKYLPAKETVMYQYKYYADYIDPDKFQNALFKDPGFVRRSVTPDGEKFIDVTSLMTVDHLTNMIFYVNPSQALEAGTEYVSTDLLRRSIDFINDHAGWTDNYKYFSIEPINQRATFQLFLKGYPVFNREGMSEIRVYWGKEEIYQYRRPYFILDVQLPHPTKVDLSSGEEMMDALLDDPDFEIEKFQELILGYRIYKDPDNSKLMILDPGWYFLYDGNWQRIESESARGDIIGLG